MNPGDAKIEMVEEENTPKEIDAEIKKRKEKQVKVYFTVKCQLPAKIIIMKNYIVILYLCLYICEVN